MDITLERILSLLPHKPNGKIVHGAKAEFARKLGFSEGNIVSMWERGVSSSYMGYLYEIARMYNVSLEWLRGETDERQPQQAGPVPEILTRYNELDEHGRHLVDMILDAEWKRCNMIQAVEVVDLGTIRHYLSKPAAGPGGMVEGEDYEDIPRTADMPRGADFCLTVSGDSMEPYIQNGQRIYVNEAAELRPFEVGVWCVDGATYVKQYAPGYSGEVYLLSANPKREAANLTIWPSGGQSVQYFGKVLGLPKLPEPIYK